jgi:hypothetical protein
MKWRPQEPFTEADLETVVMWIIKEFKAKRRLSLAGLRFNVLIGRPEEFEQLLNQIRAEQRAKTQPNTLKILRKFEPAKVQETGHSRRVTEILKESTFSRLLEGMREAAQ